MHHLLLPGSKSITNRDLILAALSPRPMQLNGMLLSEDTGHMIQALRQIGYHIEVNADQKTAHIHTCGPHILQSFKWEQTCYLGNSGTSMRFLAAVVSLIWGGQIALTGNPRMLQRPISELTQSLQSLGAQITDTWGYPPLVITPGKLWNSEVNISGEISSQFISALMHIGPLLPQGLQIQVEGELVSAPYVEMTCTEMHKFGARVVFDGNQVKIAPGGYDNPVEVQIEWDASALSYWALYLVLHGGSIAIDNLGLNSTQGDLALLKLLETYGLVVESFPDHLILTCEPVDLTKATPADRMYDFTQMPDVALTFACLAGLLPGTTHISGLQTLNKKECRRIDALAQELTRLGAKVASSETTLTILSPIQLTNTLTEIHTYDDHRMAMSFGILATYLPNIQIQNPTCVAKTYPEFWHDLARIHPSKEPHNEEHSLEWKGRVFPRFPK